MFYTHAMKKMFLILLAGILWYFVTMMATGTMESISGVYILVLYCMLWIWVCIYGWISQREKLTAKKIAVNLIAPAFFLLGFDALTWLVSSVQVAIENPEYLATILQAYGVIIAVAGGVSYTTWKMVKEFKNNQAMILAARGHPSL